MKTQIALLTVLFMLSSSCITKMSDKGSKFKKSDKDYSFIESYKIAQSANLNIYTSGGNINTYGYEGDQIEVSFIVTKYGNVLDMTLDELKQVADLEINSDNSNLFIKISNIYDKSLNVGFEIKMPFSTSAFLNTSGGNISVADLTSNQDINTSGGNIAIKNIEGKVDANTSGGNVSIDHSTGNINATTSGGNITLNCLKGNVRSSTSGGNILTCEVQGLLDVSSSGGSIHMNDISGSIRAFTSAGDISATVNQLTDKLELETSGGNINCTVPKNLGLNLNLSADNIDTPLSNFSGNAKKHKIQGKINGGGIPVNLMTSGGSMNLNYQ